MKAYLPAFNWILCSFNCILWSSLDNDVVGYSYYAKFFFKTHLLYINTGMVFYRCTDEVEVHIEEMDTETQDSSDKTEAAFTIRQYLKTSYLMPFFVACSLQIIQQFSGISAVRKF